MAQKWRKEAVNNPGGVSWRLSRGRNEERIRVNLGPVSEADADKALARMQAEEDGGAVQRILALHQDDQPLAVRYLVGDPDAVSLLPEPLVDYGALTLREYHEAVYAPWRKVENRRGWRSESGHWARILSELGTLRLREIDAHVVADYLDGMKSERGPRKGLPAAGNTKRLRRAALQALLIRAERLRHLERAPDLARFRLKDATRTVMERSDPLSLEELVALLKASGPKHRAMWAVGAGEGLRPSELMRVCWQDVDWEQRTLAVRGDDVDGEGKTALSVDAIPMTPLAYQELQAWWLRQGQPREGHAFPSKGGAPYTEGGYRKALDTAAGKAGIKRDVTPYLLRHSFATIAWSLGIEKDVARRVLRHADERMLDSVYCRPRPADLVARVAAFASPPPKEAVK
jgi:integrase